jgi:hypothetical protein
MDTEQTQGEGGPLGREEKALEALRWDWDTAYVIGHDDEHGWYDGRRDRIGELITADDPDALRRKIAENYAIKPVPREPRRRTETRTPGRVLGTDPGELMTRSAEP